MEKFVPQNRQGLSKQKLIPHKLQKEIYLRSTLTKIVGTNQKLRRLPQKATIKKVKRLKI
jgi:hypothetical protein